MINIEIIQNGLMLVGFKVEGHAGYAPIGQDIVCAAVSVLAQGTALGLSEVAAIDTDYDSSDGHISCIIKSATIREMEDADLLIRSMRETLKHLEKQYEKHIKVFTKELKDVKIEISKK